MTNCRSGLRVLPPQTLGLMPVESSAPRSIPDNLLAIRVRHKPKYVLVTVAGEIDIATVARLRECLRPLAARGRPLVADFEQVSFMDASGLGALAGVARLAAEHGASLQVACARPQIRQLSGSPGWTARYRWPAPRPRRSRSWRHALLVLALAWRNGLALTA